MSIRTAGNLAVATACDDEIRARAYQRISNVAAPTARISTTGSRAEQELRKPK
jgi:hypothetical protein